MIFTFLGSSPFVIPLDDPDLVFGVNEIGVRPRNAEAICDQQRINRFNFDIIVDCKYIVLDWVWFGQNLQPYSYISTEGL